MAQKKGDNKNDDKLGEINLPFGLDRNSIAPPSLDLTKDVPIDKLITGRKKKMKNPYQKHLEETEQKKKEEANETAAMMDVLIESFNDKKPNVGKAFVRGATEGGKTAEVQVGAFYQPKPLYNIPLPKENEEERIQPTDSSNKKKRAIDELKEEIARSQQKRTQTFKKRKIDGEEYSPDESMEYSTSQDPTTTNLYVGNLNPITTEESLYHLFSQCGIIASVKVMWPYKEEERQRNRNCGFVAFMTREGAEKAYKELQGYKLFDFDINIGWGKNVILPLRPFIPPPMWGLPQQRYPIPLNAIQLPPSMLQIVIPTDIERRQRIEKLASFVVKQGLQFEHLIKQKEMQNPDFQFLFQDGSPDNLFYRWKIYSLSQGDAMEDWSTVPFIMHPNGPAWVPPLPPGYCPVPVSNSRPYSPTQVSSDSDSDYEKDRNRGRSRSRERDRDRRKNSRSRSKSREKERDRRGRSHSRSRERDRRRSPRNSPRKSPRKSKHSRSRSRSKERGRTSTYSSGSSTSSTEKRSNIRDVKVKRLPQTQRDELLSILRDLNTSRHKILMAMGFSLEFAEYALEISEIISSQATRTDSTIHAKIAKLFLISDILFNSSAVVNGSIYRKGFQEHLVKIFESLNESFQSITGRISALNAKDKVLRVIRGWESWSLYPQTFLNSLQAAFLFDKEKNQKESLVDDELDGVPLYDDIDGEPLY